MKITKYGHCCLLLETAGLRVLTDPGVWSSKLDTLENIDLILITHEHHDHLHIDGLIEILEKNPQAEVITNSAVGKILSEKGIPHTVLEGKSETSRNTLAIEAINGEHAEIFKDFGLVQNTGYFIDNKFYYPGDSYTLPDKPMEILAVPVAGPWCRSADALNFTLKANPKTVIPVHDAILNDEGLNLVYGLFDSKLSEAGIKFIKIKNFEPTEF